MKSTQNQRENMNESTDTEETTRCGPKQEGAKSMNDTNCIKENKNMNERYNTIERDVNEAYGIEDNEESMNGRNATEEDINEGNSTADIDEQFVDNYSHMEQDVYYTTHSIPGPGVDIEEFYSQISRSCHCTLKSNQESTDINLKSTEKIFKDIDDIPIKTTETVELTVNAQVRNEKEGDRIQKGICGGNCPCIPSRNYIDGILDFDSYQLPMYECNDFCKCRNVEFIKKHENSSENRRSMSCSNRLTQKGPHTHLEIFCHSEIPNKGYGVKATTNIRRGEFICEYVGEVIDKMEAKRRYAYYKHEQMNDREREIDTGNSSSNFYIFHLNEFAGESSKRNDELQIEKTSSGFEMFVDAMKFGNISRYINHSCDPNCTVLPVRVNSIYPRLAIFAKRDIAVGEELAYDYAGLDDDLNVGSVEGSTDNTHDSGDIVHVLRSTRNSDECNDHIDGVNLKTTEKTENNMNVVSVFKCIEKGVNTFVLENDTATRSSSNTRTEECSNERDNELDLLEKLMENGTHSSLADIENENVSDLKPCLCASVKCRKFLPYLPLH